LKEDLQLYAANNELFTKYNKLENHSSYTEGWTQVINSSPNSDYALLSPVLGDTNFQVNHLGESPEESFT